MRHNMLRMVCKHCRETVADTDVTTREMNLYDACCEETRRELSHLKAHFTKKANQHGRWKVDTIDNVGNTVDSSENFIEPSFYDNEMHR